MSKTAGRTWKDLGYSSLNGGIYYNFHKNDKILDVEPMSRACTACVFKEPLKKLIL